MTYWEMAAAVFGGSVFGAFLGPLLLQEWQDRRHAARRRDPRISLLKNAFSQIETPIVSLRDLLIRCVCDVVETRDLLVRMGATGTTLSNGEEGWVLDTTKWKLYTISIDKRHAELGR